MVRQILQVLLFATLPLTAMLAGYALARSTDDHGFCGNVCFLATTVALSFGLAALVSGSPGGSQKVVGRVLGSLLLFYIYIAVMSERFVWISSHEDLYTNAAWLVPVIAGGMMLPRRNHWLNGVACLALVFAGSTALTFSTCDKPQRVGLIIMRRH
jgi:hypothetical protein